MEFWPIFDIFHGLRPYLCSKRQDLGFHKQNTHRRRGDEPFFYSGVDRSWLGMVHFGPKMAKHGRLVNAPKWPKRDQNGQPKYFWTFGTLLGPSGPFWTISDKNQFVAQKDKEGFGDSAFEQKIIFRLKWSKRVQTGPKGSQMVKKSRLTISNPFGPISTTLECWKGCHVWPFLYVLLVPFFWDTLQSECSQSVVRV